MRVHESWDHSALATDGLKKAAGALRAFPLRGEHTASLLKLSEFVCRLRDALKGAAWHELAALLESAADAEILQDDEVRSAGIALDEIARV